MEVDKVYNRKIILKRGPLPLRYVLLLTFVIFNFLSIFSLIIINKNIDPIIIRVAETKARQIASHSINDAISKNIAEEIDISKLIITHENGELSFNPQVYNRVIAETTLSVQNYIDFLEDGVIKELSLSRNNLTIDYEQSKKQNGIIYYVPLGMATNTTLLSNLGPQIPVRLEMLGFANTNIETKASELGINNTYLEFYINVTVQINVIIPSLKEPIEVTNRVKIGDLFIKGEVPDFYNGSGNNEQITPILIPPDETQKDTD